MDLTKMVDYLKRSIDGLDDLKVEWGAFIKERFDLYA